MSRHFQDIETEAHTMSLDSQRFVGYVIVDWSVTTKANGDVLKNGSVLLSSVNPEDTLRKTVFSRVKTYGFDPKDIDAYIKAMGKIFE